MKKQARSTGSAHEREAWLRSIRRLVNQVADWSEAQGWPVVKGQQQIDEPPLGSYDAPTARVRVNGGELYLKPIALYVLGGADGRVDLEGWPTLNRVKLLRRKGKWVVYTDSNIPLRETWGRRLYVQLARDLLA